MRPTPGFNWANVVTSLRLVLAVSLWLLGPAAAWMLVGVAATGAILDVVDGPIARRSGRTTAFGARFDMETDALLILTLSVLVWRIGHAGVWVVASGLMRYAFIAAGWLLPWMRADLPASVRRQTVCVVQIVTLITALAPIVTPPLSTTISAMGLAILTWSFYVDVAWLARRRAATASPG